MGLLESTCVGNPRTFYTQKTQKMTRIWPSEAYSGGGAIGAKPTPLDQWNLLISGDFHAPMGAEPPPGKKKI